MLSDKCCDIGRCFCGVDTLNQHQFSQSGLRNLDAIYVVELSLAEAIVVLFLNTDAPIFVELTAELYMVGVFYSQVV